MDALFLSRLQFTSTTFIHFLFVPLTIGLAFMIAMMETRYARTGDAEYKRMAKFWGKLFLINFAMGVVTGIILEFEFGTNWARYSEYVGDIFGSLLAIEATGFFFLESVMIGVWIFGWNRISPKAHAIVMWLITFATCGSAFWILTANAWMQNPVGYTIRNGRAELTDLLAVMLNPTALLSIFHTVSAAAALSAFFVMGISAWHLLRKHEVDFFTRSFRIALIVGSVAMIGILLGGDMLGADIAEVQAAKLAAMESHWETGSQAPMHLIVWPDEQNERNKIELFPMPGVLSLLAFKDVDAVVTGLKEIPPDERPPIAMTMVNFRLMIAIGTVMVGLLIIAWVYRNRLTAHPILLQLLVVFIPFPYIAANAGWIMTEVGRQPWIVYGLMKTADGLSPGLKTHQAAASFFVLTIVLTILTAVAAGLIVRFARRGPLPIEAESDDSNDNNGNSKARIAG